MAMKGKSNMIAEFSHCCAYKTEMVYKTRNRTDSAANHSMRTLVLQTVLIISALLPGLYSTEMVAGREHTVSGKVGESVVLPCEVDSHNCGRIYVITFTKFIGDEWRRVYLYSDTHSKPMNSFAGRAHFILHNNSNAELHLRSLNVSDEGTYKCDVTYVHGKCPSLTFTKLYTLNIRIRDYLIISDQQLG